MARLSGRILAVLSLLMALGASARSEPLQLFQQEIEAGLLYNFLKYTQWPAAEDISAGDAVVCLIGAGPFERQLAPMASRTVNRRGIEIRTVTIQALDGCWLLFVRADQQADWPGLQKRLAGKPILTVADFAPFAASGGMIEFTRTDDRIGVKVNVDAVTAAHLAIQDRLLRLADTVHAAE
jgi:hypothetical protein